MICVFNLRNDVFFTSVHCVLYDILCYNRSCDSEVGLFLCIFIVALLFVKHKTISHYGCVCICDGGELGGRWETYVMVIVL